MVLAYKLIAQMLEESDLRANIHHITEYRYPEPAFDSFNEVRLKPIEDARQSVLSFQFQLEPNVPAYWHLDYYGTTLHHFHVLEKHNILRIETHALVLTHAMTQPIGQPASVLEPHKAANIEYLTSSRRVPLEFDWATILGWHKLKPEEDYVAYLDGLNSHLNSRFTYQSGVTKVDTPLLEFVQGGVGVCQDYVHAMLAVARSNGLPSRYVSGYLYAGADFVGAEATHAWLECLIPGYGWLGFDPTNNVRINESHIKIGHGRDYDDVPPLRGLRRGGGVESIGVEVSVHVQQ